MRRLLAITVLTLALTFQALPAWASCTTHTYTIDGRMVSCSTCCFGNHCSTTCF